METDTMKSLITASLTALSLTLPSFAAAEMQTLGTLEISEPFTFVTAKGVKAGGGFVSITNTGSEADALIAARADFPKVEIHTTEEKDGIARMMHVDRIEIPAGETVSLAPGGFHVMFMGLSDPFEMGEEIPVTLVFEKAGEVEVMFPVKERTGAMGHGHKNMKEHNHEHNHSN
jgi:copper(I)-binding protein